MPPASDNARAFGGAAALPNGLTAWRWAA